MGAGGEGAVATRPSNQEHEASRRPGGDATVLPANKRRRHNLGPQLWHFGNFLPYGIRVILPSAKKPRRDRYREISSYEKKKKKPLNDRSIAKEPFSLAHGRIHLTPFNTGIRQLNTWILRVKRKKKHTHILRDPDTRCCKTRREVTNHFPSL